MIKREDERWYNLMLYLFHTAAPTHTQGIVDKGPEEEWARDRGKPECCASSWGS